jgi:hypothetical protein
MKRESEKHKRMIESVRLRGENEALKLEIKGLKADKKILREVMERDKERIKALKHIVKNIKMYLTDKTYSLSKAKQLITDSQAAITDLIAREEAYNDILKYIEGKGY